MRHRRIVVFCLPLLLLINRTAFAADGERSIVSAAIDTLAAIVFFQVPIFGQEVEVIVLWMAAAMIFVTFYFGFINLRCFGVAARILKGAYKDNTAPGEVSQVQALSTALSGTVGLGNISGVAIAIAAGGPGAAFWMVIVGFFAMTLKFSECTLSTKYRRIKADGTVSGGPMYYLGTGLKERGLPRLGSILGWCYGIFGLFVIPQFITVNQIYSQVSFVTGFEGVTAQWIFGVILMALVAVVIIGGIKSISKVTVRLVPLMAAIYISGALFVIFTHLGELPGAVATIVGSALQPQAGIGAVIGAFVWGMRRAVYSTEAGWGTASIAHAAAKTREPVSEGMVALLEPFIDTVVICSMTALVIVLTGAHELGLADIQMTTTAFNSVVPGFENVLLVAAFLFGYSTIISWGYYCSKFWGFVFGESARSMMTYRIVFCLLIIPGPILTVSQVVDLMDSFYFLLAIPNILGIYLLAPILKRDLHDYLARLKAGEIKRTDRAAPVAAE